MPEPAQWPGWLDVDHIMRTAEAQDAAEIAEFGQTLPTFADEAERVYGLFEAGNEALAAGRYGDARRLLQHVVDAGIAEAAPALAEATERITLMPNPSSLKKVTLPPENVTLQVTAFVEGGGSIQLSGLVSGHRVISDTAVLLDLELAGATVFDSRLREALLAITEEHNKAPADGERRRAMADVLKILLAIQAADDGGSVDVS